MTDNIENAGSHGDEMAEYLQTFLDETEEQLDDLVETMLSLEVDSNNADELNEAFRLIHSIKGAAGMLGLDSISALTHHLENRFERFRSGLAQLDEPTMNLVLRCIDFLRQCLDQLRDGQQLRSSSTLLDELRRLEEIVPHEDSGDNSQLSDGRQYVEPVKAIKSTAAKSDEHEAEAGVVTVIVHFRSGLQLVDLKAQLIVSRLSGLGNVQSTRPILQQLSDIEPIEKFEVRLETSADAERLRAVADVEGVESIELFSPPALPVETDPTEPMAIAAGIAGGDPIATTNSASDADSGIEDRKENDREFAEFQQDNQSVTPASPLRPESVTPVTTPDETVAKKVSDTMRVDIDRLDNLMNLVGELVVNRARFAQISGQIDPALRRAAILNGIRQFSDNLRRMIGAMEHRVDVSADWSAQVEQLREGLDLMKEQSEIWESGRQSLTQLSEAIDQLTRISNNLQRGVMDTRMVAVGPLFNRFKRVIRDLSKDRGKKVNLQLRGENTELDKRMIDELGDPLVHLVRNSIDHGLEQPDIRKARGKSDAGTIFLEASHSGNNVHILVRDDGGGIDVAKIKAKLIANQVLPESAVHELSDEQALDYIWHPGFSTAKEVTDVSGRGVGMDVVKTRIQELNGTVEVNSAPLQGTTFTIRLPLTLAIINSLLVRRHKVLFSIPIDDVREIVSISQSDVVTVHNKLTFEARGEFILLVRLDDVFQWHRIDYGYESTPAKPSAMTDGFTSLDANTGTDSNMCDSRSEATNRETFFKVVILHSAGRTIGLRVDELLGNQDVVIKSLTDNFVNIRGLSGASIQGDGSICLMLDVGTVIGIASNSTRSIATEEVIN